VLSETSFREEALGARDALDCIRSIEVLVPLMADEGIRTRQQLAASWMIAHDGPSTPGLATLGVWGRLESHVAIRRLRVKDGRHW
jgi:hypothetical protein